jgi:uracil-DNA glycosylase
VEIQICLPFIQRQIELADPDILVCVGQRGEMHPATTTQLTRRVSCEKLPTSESYAPRQ